MEENLYKYRYKLDWENTEFCENKAYICSKLSKLIYKYKPAELNDRTCFYEINDNVLNKYSRINEFHTFFLNLDIRLIFIFENKDSITIGLSIGRAIIIVSRETSYWKDWAYNLNAFKTKVCYKENLKFHKGFNKIATKTIDKIYKIILNETISIYFPGHSLGGALSAIFYYNFVSNCNCIRDVTLKNKNKISAYTFGMPRFSNKTLKQTDSFFNLYNPLDIIPMVPIKKFGYTNQKCEYKLSEFGLELTREREHIGFLKKMNIFIKGNVF